MINTTIILTKQDLDYLHDLAYDAYGVDLDIVKLRTLWKYIPEDIKLEVDKWGLSDTVVRELIYIWLQSQDIYNVKEEDNTDKIDVKIYNETIHSVLTSIMDTNLSEREKMIIKLRYGLVYDKQYTLEEIGKIYDVNRERIRQIETKAMIKLKHHVNVYNKLNNNELKRGLKND